MPLIILLARQVTDRKLSHGDAFLSNQTITLQIVTFIDILFTK